MLPAKTKEAQLPAKGAFARAVERYRTVQEGNQRGTRIGFLIDATGSRNDTWEKAQMIQTDMFKSVSGLRALSLRLIHFGGLGITNHGWLNDPRAVATRMAAVRCITGYTQILPALMAFVDEPAHTRADAVILIGDSFEESIDEAERVALALKGAGIKVFSFFEGEHFLAEPVFRRLAEVTGGKFARFGAGLPLADLCKGVALLTAGGEKAVKRLQNGKVKQLLLTGPSAK